MNECLACGIHEAEHDFPSHTFVKGAHMITAERERLLALFHHLAMALDYRRMESEAAQRGNTMTGFWRLARGHEGAFEDLIPAPHNSAHTASMRDCDGFRCQSNSPASAYRHAFARGVDHVLDGLSPNEDAAYEAEAQSYDSDPRFPELWDAVRQGYRDGYTAAQINTTEA